MRAPPPRQDINLGIPLSLGAVRMRARIPRSISPDTIAASVASYLLGGNQTLLSQEKYQLEQVH
jgi:hypothetical protein